MRFHAIHTKNYVSFKQAAKIHVIFISFETLTPPPGVHVVIKGGRKTPEALRKEIGDACTPSKSELVVLLNIPFLRCLTLLISIS